MSPIRQLKFTSQLGRINSEIWQRRRMVKRSRSSRIGAGEGAAAIGGTGAAAAAGAGGTV